MKYATVCSGIEAPSAAWESLGWQPQFFSEIEAFPNAVLAHHYPSVPNLGDFTTIKGDDYRGTVDLICAGSPCQSFSVAGKRAGLDDPRGNLAIEFIRLVGAVRPKWVLWENVPGVLSSWSDAEEEGYETNDFDTFLSLLAESGYGFAWRILEASSFGVAQRRRRVFVVGCLGDWRSAAAVLFEQESLLRTPSSRRKTGSDIADTLKGGSGARGFQLDNETGLTLERGAQPYCIKGAAIGRKPEAGPQYGEILDDGKCYTLNCTETHAIAFTERTREGGRQLEWQYDKSYALTNPGAGGRSQERLILAPTLSTKNEPANSSTTRDEWYATSAEILGRVRRLTPLECERLQGFQDGWTDISFRGKPASDSVRYKAIGNSMAVPVIRWIGRRIEMVDNLTNKLEN